MSKLIIEKCDPNVNVPPIATSIITYIYIYIYIYILIIAKMIIYL